MQEEIRLLSLWQPWASLIAMGVKKVETRHWYTPYRGLLAIHAAKRKIDADGKSLMAELSDLIPDGCDLPYGAIVAVARLDYCTEMVVNNEQQAYCYVQGSERFYPSATEEICGYWDSGRYAWMLEDIRPIDPISIPGKQGLSVIRDAELLGQIEKGLSHATD